MMRTINHPGVEIREIDKSQYTPAMAGTSTYLVGYSNKGDFYTPYNITSLEGFEAIFGKPGNEAERYFYYGGTEVIKNNGNLIAARIPYSGNAASTNYKANYLSFEGISSVLSSSLSGEGLNDIGPLSAINYYNITQNVNNISTSAYDELASNGTYPSNSGDFLIVNERRSNISGPKQNEGVFTVVLDFYDGLKYQRLLSGASDSDDMNILSSIVAGGNTWSNDVDFITPLTETFNKESVSRTLASQFPNIDFVNNGASVSTDYTQWLTIVVCESYADANKDGKLGINILESFNGSIRSEARDNATGKSTYICNVINDNSDYIKMYKNEGSSILSELSAISSTFLTTDKQSQYLLSFNDNTTDPDSKVVNGGTISTDLLTCFEKVSDKDELQIDLVVDAGLTTIAQYTSGGATFNPSVTGATTIDSSTSLAVWRDVVTTIDNFCSSTRKDCMAIIDGPRDIVLQKDLKYIRKSAPDNTFSNTIGPKLKYITGINSSYSAMYIDWLKMIDRHSGKNFWFPPSIKMAGIYIYNDQIANIWDAPAGLNRGIIDGVNDLAFNPNGKAADQVYLKSFNYVKKYPLDGFIAEGQKTTQVKPSAFDRVNVRRMFLRLERMAYQVSRYFVYEPNNIFTRRRLVDLLEPTFKSFKAKGGLYDYRIICDKNNNTPSVIDRNELKVAILLKPVKTAEFILIDFIATNTGANFEEIIQETV